MDRKRPQKNKPPRRLNKEELRERLILDSNGLVEELHALSIRQLQSEDLREGRLDSKAQGLLGAASLSLTVAFSFGGILSQHTKYFGTPTFVLYALALLCGLGASLAAVRALFVSNNYGTIADDDAFSSTELAAIEQDIAAEPNQAKDKDKMAQCLFRRYLIVQQWTIYRMHFDEHERKATIIKFGQVCFMLFLLLLLLTGIVSAATALTA